jgi:hypothetical protein
VDAVQLVSDPVPVWFVAAGVEAPRQPPVGELETVDRALLACLFRAVSIDRLGTVLTTGVDVEPSDAVVYADSFEKAWEYGGWPKVVLALSLDKLDRTYRELPADTDAEELALVQQRFPTVLPAVDGTTLWCSRLAQDDPCIAKSYEREYAWWIPGDPFEALRAVLLFGPAGEIMTALRG